MEHVSFWYMLSFIYFVTPQVPQLVDASRRTGLDINAENAYYVPYPCIKEYIQGVPGGMDTTSGECSLC